MTRKVVFSGMVPLRRTRGLVAVAVVVAGHKWQQLRGR